MPRARKIPTSHIVVMGDTWKRLLIVPKGASKNSDYYTSLLLDGAAASRLFRLVKAVTECKDIAHYFVPSETREISVASGLLKEYHIEDSVKEVFRKLYPNNGIKEVYRMEKSLGVGAIKSHDNSQPIVTNYPKSAKDHCERNKSTFWIIFEDHTVNEDEEIKSERKALFKAIKNLKPNNKHNPLPDYILWNPRDFGKKEVTDNDVETRYQSCLFGNNNNNNNNNIAGQLRDKTIVFLRMDKLTEYGIGNRDDISVEECLDGLTDAFSYNPQMKNLLKCKAIIISCGIDFAFLVYNEDNKTKFEVFFRPIRTCQFYHHDNGFLHGYGILMVASCLKVLHENPKGWKTSLSEAEANDTNKFNMLDSIRTGINDGLWRMLLQFYIGYPVKSEGENDIIDEQYKRIYQPVAPKLKTLDKNTNELNDTVKPFAVQHVTLENYRNKIEHPSVIYRLLYKYNKKSNSDFVAPWLLEQQWDTKGDNGEKNKFLRDVVKKGLKRMSSDGEIEFPVANFGKMNVVDPEEITMFRNMQSLMRKYVLDGKNKKPLGLAVFGAPGSGKSFGIKEVIKGVWEISKTEHLKLIECNLAQFTSPNDLSKKLLEAQDMSIAGNNPTIFLDEFDSKFEGEKFGWFKYLLALLQDGTFRYDGALHQLGKCFVICAGGLNRSFLEFSLRSSNDEFIAAKGPDLISRLRGYVNIKGPNPYSPFSFNGPVIDKIVPQTVDSVFDNYRKNLGKSVKDLAEYDSLYKIRRAITIRTLLKVKMPSIFGEDKMAVIHDNVLNALLNISEYKYGTRSIEAIIDMSVSVYRHSRSFVKAMIPPPEQLEMHVDAVEFYSLLGSFYDTEK